MYWGVVVVFYLTLLGLGFVQLGRSGVRGLCFDIYFEGS